MNTNTAIYTAIRSFATAEKAKGNGWAELAEAIAYLPAAEAEGHCTEAEAAFKKNNKGATIPGAFRTAKSVALKAIRLDVPLVDGDGKARGKTAVEKDCKEAQAAADTAEIARIEGSETEHGELVQATAAEYLARFSALILAAKESGFDPAAIFADAYARTLPQDAI